MITAGRGLGDLLSLLLRQVHHHRRHRPRRRRARRSSTRRHSLPGLLCQGELNIFTQV